MVLATAGPEVAVEFHDALFANQPEEGGPDQQHEEGHRRGGLAGS